MDLQSEWMTQDGKETMAGRWPGMLGGLDVRDTLDQSYLRLSQLVHSMSRFPLTYQSELINEDWGEGITFSIYSPQQL